MSVQVCNGTALPLPLPTCFEPRGFMLRKAGFIRSMVCCACIGVSSLVGKIFW